MSKMDYISHAKYPAFEIAVFDEMPRMKIEIRIDELLQDRERTYYWLAKESGISHTTLWRLKKGRALGINFRTLEKICAVLECSPGDVLNFEEKQSVPKGTPKRK